MNNSLGNTIDRLVIINQHFLDVLKLKCLDVSYEKWIDSLKNETWDDSRIVGCNNFFLKLSIYKSPNL